MTCEDILVIGAGPAGLAASACLRREGLEHQVLEREASIGPAWRRHYDRLHLHTTRTYSALPMTPWPKGTPRYPSREQVVRYLEAYAEEHRIAPRLGVAVNAVRRGAERFEVDTSAGVMRPRVVVMATGYNGVPVWPSIPGLQSFRGTAIHSGAYKNAAPFQGRRTLVVGCGNSGAEIALDLAEQGVDVAMVVRGPVHVVPRDLLGRPTQHTNVLLSHLPLGLRDALAVAMVGLVVGDLSRWGIVRPALGPNRMIEETGRIPMLDLGTIAMVKRRKIRVLPAVLEMLADQVRFADGSVHPFEALVFATGYAPGLGRLIEGFESIADGRGRPHRFGAETGIAGLYCVGFRNPPTGALREIALEAPRVARAIRSALPR
ncbi:MAG: NAD(P)/FAD-dependent oxidoreductase [Burkholderiales bacterium]|nr:NAD(P)/FAD-dependent oxidoreductase [Burkholderiales bacterium]MDE2454808.1 NAD(P)/FAD-dependent oxidoreductase [Burkholderiales bacterium]